MSMDPASLQAILAQLSQFAPNTGNAPPQSRQDENEPQITRSFTSINAAAPSPRPVIDPASITTWQEGLRCVTKIAAQNAQFAASIKRMMQTQREHEIRWYTERQNLKRTHSNRATSTASAQSILASLGASVTRPAEQSSEAHKDAELLEFDQKVYAAQQAMETGMTAELKGLGVPFFGVKEDLVVPDELEVKRAEEADGMPKWSAVVTESEMRELRRRMINHLEDLYRD